MYINEAFEIGSNAAVEKFREYLCANAAKRMNLRYVRIAAMTHSRTCKPILALLVTTLAASACTATTPDKTSHGKPSTALQGSDCIFFHTLYDWQSLDDHNMVIWAPSKRDAYHVYFMAPLIGLNFSLKLAFVDKDHDGRLCGFSNDEIVVNDTGYPQRVTITAMKHLDAEGIAKLEEQYKVKLTRDSKKTKPKEPDRETAK